MLQRFTEHEWWRPQADAADDDDGVLKDGEVIRKPLRLMDGDSTQRKALDALHEDAARRRVDDAYEDHDRRKCEAWRNPPPLPLRTDASKPIPALQKPTDQMDPREQYLHRLQNAWRTP